jgi:hypothetical protein
MTQPEEQADHLETAVLEIVRKAPAGRARDWLVLLMRNGERAASSPAKSRPMPESEAA